MGHIFSQRIMISSFLIRVTRYHTWGMSGIYSFNSMPPRIIKNVAKWRKTGDDGLLDDKSSIFGKLDNLLLQKLYHFCLIFFTFSYFALAVQIWSLYKLWLTTNQDFHFWTGVDHGDEVHDQQHHGTKNLHKMVLNVGLFLYSAKEERQSYLFFFLASNYRLWRCWVKVYNS